MPIHVPALPAKYWYVSGVNPASGRLTVIGPFKDEEDAKRESESLDDRKIFHLPTKNLDRATSMIKAKDLRFNPARAATRRWRMKRKLGDGETPTEGGAASNALYNEDGDDE